MTCFVAFLLIAGPPRPFQFKGGRGGKSDLLARLQHFRAPVAVVIVRASGQQAEFSAIVPSELWVRLALGASARIAEKCSATLEASDDI